jgi:hypothetical protein
LPWGTSGRGDEGKGKKVRERGDAPDAPRYGGFIVEIFARAMS